MNLDTNLPDSRIQNVVESAFNLRKLKCKTGVQCPSRHDTRTLEEFCRKPSEHRSKNGSRHTENRRSAKRIRERGREGPILHGIRTYGVQCPFDGIMLNCIESQRSFIHHMNPSHPLFTIAEFRSESKLEGRFHRFQCPAIRAEHHPGAKLHDTNFHFLCLFRFRLPCLTDFREKTVAGLRGFIGDPIRRVPVSTPSRIRSLRHAVESRRRALIRPTTVYLPPG